MHNNDFFIIEDDVPSLLSLKRAPIFQKNKNITEKFVKAIEQEGLDSKFIFNITQQIKEGSIELYVVRKPKPDMFSLPLTQEERLRLEEIKKLGSTISAELKFKEEI